MLSTQYLGWYMLQSYAKSLREGESKDPQRTLKEWWRSGKHSEVLHFNVMPISAECANPMAIILITQVNLHRDAEVQDCLRTGKVASWKWNQGIGTCYCLEFCVFVFLTAFQFLTSVHANKAGCQMPLCQFIKIKRISSKRVQICSQRLSLAHIWNMTLIIQFVLLDYCSIQFTVAWGFLCFFFNLIL